MSAANLLASYDPSFETTGVNNWVPGGFSSLIQSNTEAHTGTFSMAINSNTGGTSEAIFNTLIPVLPGTIINPSIWMWTAAAGQYGQFHMVWYASDEVTIVGTSPSVITNLTSSLWTQVTSVGIQAPANAFWMQLQVISANNPGGNNTYVDDVDVQWGNYATNMCPNPSFETDLTGWSGTRGDETLTQINATTFAGEIFENQLTADYTRTLHGSSAMQVQTPGTEINEGVFGPSTWMPATTTGSMSCNIFGESGALAVQAVDQITGDILSTQIVMLTGAGWVNAFVSNLTFVVGHTYYLQVITYGPPQDLTFTIDGVMYQPEAPTQYVDGDQYQCFWTGTIEESASFQPYQFGIAATCNFIMGGTANVIDPSVVDQVQAQVLEFEITFGPDPPNGVKATILQPTACMTDFGIWQGGSLGNDLDPAMAYSTWNTQDIMSGQLQYNRPYMAVCPPLDLFNSTGGYTWKRAAYLALGWQWVNTTTSTAQILTDVQTELLPINTTSALSPRAYQPARQLQTIVKPDRLNYVTNPSFETSTAGWSSIGSQTLALSNNVPVIPGLAFSPGLQSMSVTANSATAGGVQTTLSFLIPGRTYMASVWVLPDGANIGDVTLSCAGVNGNLTTSQATGFGDLPFGEGPYGGISLQTNSLTATWQQVYFSFQATADTHTLFVSPVTVTTPAYPFTWCLDAVLVEDGDILNPYFDGNFGEDALWLDTGTPNLCQSFYYNQLQFARHIITDSLAANTPLGITYAAPLYATMPTQ